MAAKISAAVVFCLLCLAPAVAQEGEVALVVPMASPAVVQQTCLKLGVTPTSVVVYSPEGDGQITMLVPALPDLMITIYHLDAQGNKISPFAMRHHFMSHSALLLQTVVPQEKAELALCLQHGAGEEKCWLVRNDADHKLLLDPGFVLYHN